MRRVSARPLLALLLAATLAAHTAGQIERLHDDHALEPLAAALAAWSEARAEDAGVDEAEALVQASLAALAGDKGDPLRRPADLARAAWLARGYGAKDVRKGKVTDEVLKRGSFSGTGLEIAYRVPKDYDPKRTAYPLILTLPDAGEKPAEHLRTHWIHGDLLDRAILVSPALPANPEEWAVIAVDGRPGGLTHVLTTASHALDTFAADPDRVYVVGRGRSVPLALATGNHAPQRFAGIVARTGDAGDLAPANFTNLPTLFLAAGEGAAKFRDGITALGVDNCRIAEADDDAAAWRWMQEHPRATAPASVQLQTGQPFPTRAYWLRVAPSAPDASATATIERDANAIRVSTFGVSQVTLYLDDRLVDLDRPVKVSIDRVEHELAPARSLARTLELLHDGTSDTGCVYVAEVVLATGAPAASAAAAEPDPELEERVRSAGDDVEALWQLHEWAKANGRAEAGEHALRKLLRLAPDHTAAHALLGHAGSAGQWFASKEAFERFVRTQEADVAKAKGLVQQGELWIHRDERKLALEGRTKHQPTGQWLTQVELRRLSEGWVRQDLEWIAPADATRADEGLWFVDGEWVDLATANRRHASADAMWRIPTREVLVHSAADRDVALRAAEHMGRALQDLQKVFGAEPLLPLEVCVLRDEEQYDRFAFGDPDGTRRATDPARTYLVHSAYYASAWFQRVARKPVFRGMAVTFWDPVAPNGDLYGVHAARLAVGLSYVEALDPSPKTVKKALASGVDAGYSAAYEAEKLLPAWLRWGGAVYAERFFRDELAAEGADPWWARKWSLDNLKSRGGPRPLSEVLAFPLDPDDRDDSLKLLLEAGLAVAFVVDGECAPVKAAHAELKRALAAGSAKKSQVEALTQALLANEAALRAFAGV